MQDNRIKLAGLVAGVLVVVGIISLLTFTPAGVDITKGVSADIRDVATGNVKVISTEDYQQLLDNLNLAIQADETTRLAIIQDTISAVNNWE